VCEKININEVLRSITSRIYKSNKNENYEEYEFIGDCVLKLLATIEAFVEEPKHEEGELHLARARVISNSNLHAKSIKKQLFQFILTTPSEEPTPPFKFKPPSPQADTLEYKDTGIKIMDEVGAHEGYFYVPGKYHADVIEALVGIYYMRGSRRLE
jgi:dsRNA-specific ribonuclease